MANPGSDENSMTQEQVDTTKNTAEDTKTSTPPAVSPNNNDPVTPITPIQTKETDKAEKASPLVDLNRMDLLHEVIITLSIEIGRAQIKIRDLLNMTKGSIIELNKLSGEPVEIYANGKLISLGEIITVNGKYCVRLTAINEKNQIGVKENGK